MTTKDYSHISIRSEDGKKLKQLASDLSEMFDLKATLSDALRFAVKCANEKLQSARESQQEEKES